MWRSQRCLFFSFSCCLLFFCFDFVLQFHCGSFMFLIRSRYSCKQASSKMMFRFCINQAVVLYNAPKYLDICLKFDSVFFFAGRSLTQFPTRNWGVYSTWPSLVNYLIFCLAPGIKMLNYSNLVLDAVNLGVYRSTDDTWTIYAVNLGDWINYPCRDFIIILKESMPRCIRPCLFL